METFSKNIEKLTPLQRSFLVIEQLQSKLNVLEQSQTEPIAIIGMGCRLPGGADTPESFWNLLQNKVDSITEVPSDRWNIDDYYHPNPETPGKVYTRSGGFLNHIDRFDPQFFGISPKETLSLDPQHRLLLEVSWEALEHAGIAPQNLENSQTGIFFGITQTEYSRLRLANPNHHQQLSIYDGTGNSLSFASGRLSFILGSQGPNMAIDTVCSSSLVAVHLACQSLRTQESNLAIAGGVNLNLFPEATILMSRAKALSLDGRCKTFDASADGYSRSEGCGVIILKRLSEAIADGDRVWAIIRGSAVNHDGSSSGLTAPNQMAQEKLIRQALSNAKVDPTEVNYIEAHGTGTSLGDPIEVGALVSVLCANRSQSNPLVIGSAKTNLGHLESAAGIAGLIKVVLSLDREEIPPHLHFSTPNPHIPWNEVPLVVPTSPMPWSRGEKRRIAGVSSFGMSGTNAHVVLEEAPIQVKRENSTERPLHLLTLSAKTPKALEELVIRYHNVLDNHAEWELADICYTANTGRAQFNHRLAAMATSKQELAEKLHHFQAEEVTGLFSGQFSSSANSAKVAFLFTDQGSQYVQMGQQLYQKSPLFRKTIDQCDQLLQCELEHPLLSVLYPETTDKQSLSLLDQPAYSQPALFAMEYALAQLWQSWGIQPDVVMGNNVGEYVAACVAKVFSLEDGLKLIAARGRLMQELLVGGEAEFEAVAKQVTYTQPQIPLISNVTGKRVGNEITSYQYWVNHMRQTMWFAEGIQTLHQEGCKLFLEIGPKPILLETGRQCLPENVGVWLPSLYPPQQDWQQMLSSLGELYVKGVKVDWLGFDKDYVRRKVALPTYPFQRQRYWLETSENGLQENGHQKSTPDNGINAIAKILNQIDIEQIAQELSLAEQLTEQEQKLLPKLLKILTQRYQEYRQSSEKGSGILQKLEKTEARERLQITIHYLQGVVGQLLGFHDSQIPDSQLGFFDMGMDYPMMLELRDLLQTSFGCSISVTTLSDHFNIQELAKYLMTKICVGELEGKFEKDNYYEKEKQRTIINGELELLDEDAIANAMKEDLIATALQDELKEIQLLLNKEI
jgi:acyl transferase domain-containing protein